MMFSKINGSILSKSVLYTFSIMPYHFIRMLLANIIISAVPIFGIIMSREIFSNAEAAISNPIDVSHFALLLLFYALYLGVIKFYKIYYKRVSVQFSALPQFEQKIKAEFHKKASKISLLNYETPSFYNNIWEAKVASINLYRIMECILDFIAIILSIIIIGSFLSSFHMMFWLFIALSAVPGFIENIVEAKIRGKAIKAVATVSKKERAWHKCLVEPRFFKETISYGSYDFIHKKWANSSANFAETEYKVELSVFLIRCITNLFKTLSTIGIYGVSAWLFFQNEIGFGVYMASLGAALYLSAQYSNLFQTTGYFSKFLHMVKPFFRYMETEQTNSTAHSLEEISIKKANFMYPSSSEYVLRNININLKKGEKIAIIGINGVGKSTLVKMIMGYLSPSSGSVSVNGNVRDLRNSEYEFLNVTTAFQDFCKYELSIAENVSISDTSRSIDKNEVADLINEVGIDAEKILLESHLGKEFGNLDFSGGQWQRIAIARSLYKKDSKLFIFDEPTSAIDPLEEKKLNDILVNDSRETVIVISHRLSLAKVVDRVFVLHNGEIRQEGAHSDLVLQDGYYRKMWEAQSEWYKD